MPGKLCAGNVDVPKLKESRAFCEGRAARAAAVTADAVGTSGVEGEDTGITWTAQGGGAGIKVKLVDPNDTESALSVEVHGLTVVVFLETDVAGDIISTAAEVYAAVAALAAAAALVEGTDTGLSDGSGVVEAETVTLGGSSNPHAYGSEDAAAFDLGIASKVADDPDGCCGPTGAAAGGGE